MSGSLSARIGRALVPGLPFLWLAAFFLLPFLIVLKISLSDPATAQPPYRPLLDLSLEGFRAFLSGLDFENFATLLIRVYAWVVILRPEGLLGQALVGVGLLSEPLAILNTETAVFIGLVYA